jgi:hypothetical protein
MGGSGVTARNKEELYRRLAQTQRLLAEPLDPLTKERLQGLAFEIQKQLTVAEIEDTDAPPE